MDRTTTMPADDAPVEAVPPAGRSFPRVLPDWRRGLTGWGRPWKEPREVFWLLLAWAILLPFQIPLFSDAKRNLHLALSDVVLLVALLFAFAHFRFRHRAWSGWHFALPIALALSVLFGGSLSRYAIFNKLIGILVLLAAYAFITSLVTSWERLHALIQWFATAVVLANTLAIGALIVGFDLPGRICHSDGCLRLTGFYHDANIYGSLLIVALAFVLGTMGSSARLMPESLPTILAISSLVIGLFLTLSRSSWIGVALMVLVMAVVRPQKAVRTLLFSGLLLGGVTAVIFGDRVTELFGAATRTFSIDSRFDIIDNALGAFAENPAFGIGLGNFSERYDAIVHNTALWLATELGVVGLIIFVGLFLWISWRVVWLYRRTVGAKREMVLALGMAHLAMFGFSLGVEALYQRHWWLVMGLIAAAFAIESSALDPGRADASLESTDTGA